MENFSAIYVLDKLDLQLFRTQKWPLLCRIRDSNIFHQSPPSGVKCFVRTRWNENLLLGKVACQLPGVTLPNRRDAMPRPHQPGQGEEQIGTWAILPEEAGLTGEVIRRPEAPTRRGNCGEYINLKIIPSPSLHFFNHTILFLIAITSIKINIYFSQNL